MLGPPPEAGAERGGQGGAPPKPRATAVPWLPVTIIDTLERRSTVAFGDGRGGGWDRVVGRGRGRVGVRRGREASFRATKLV